MSVPFPGLRPDTEGTTPFIVHWCTHEGPQEVSPHVILSFPHPARQKGPRSSFPHVIDIFQISGIILTDVKSPFCEEGWSHLPGMGGTWDPYITGAIWSFETSRLGHKQDGERRRGPEL